MSLRFAGQDTGVTLVNATTNAEVLRGMHAENFSFSIMTEMVTKRYLGQIGPQVTSFYDGYEFSFDYDPNSPVTLLEFQTLLIAKLRREVLDEFAVRTTFSAPDAGSFSVVFKDPQFDTTAFTMGGQHELLKSAIKARGNVLKLSQV